ncbi:MAG: hypothetical protein HY881_16050 [Deltaproteobacteria bacterium]|nr:hypothetical protein [Deltaproteobacteria bacterium]
MLNMGQTRRECERAKENLRDVESGRAREYWQGKVNAFWKCLVKLENEEMKPVGGFLADPDSSTGKGIYKMINDALIAYDGFMTKYEQENATVQMAEVTS